MVDALETNSGTGGTVDNPPASSVTTSHHPATTNDGSLVNASSTGSNAPNTTQSSVYLSNEHLVVLGMNLVIVHKFCAKFLIQNVAKLFYTVSLPPRQLYDHLGDDTYRAMAPVLALLVGLVHYAYIDLGLSPPQHTRHFTFDFIGSHQWNFTDYTSHCLLFQEALQKHIKSALPEYYIPTDDPPPLRRRPSSKRSQRSRRNSCASSRSSRSSRSSSSSTGYTESPAREFFLNTVLRPPVPLIAVPPTTTPNGDGVQATLSAPTAVITPSDSAPTRSNVDRSNVAPNVPAHRSRSRWFYCHFFAWHIFGYHAQDGSYPSYHGSTTRFTSIPR